MNLNNESNNQPQVYAKETDSQWRIVDGYTVKTDITKKTRKAPYGFTAEEALAMYAKHGKDAERKFREENGFD